MARAQAEQQKDQQDKEGKVLKEDGSDASDDPEVALVKEALEILRLSGPDWLRRLLSSHRGDPCHRAWTVYVGGSVGTSHGETRPFGGWWKIRVDSPSRTKTLSTQRARGVKYNRVFYLQLLRTLIHEFRHVWLGPGSLLARIIAFFTGGDPWHSQIPGHEKKGEGQDAWRDADGEEANAAMDAEEQERGKGNVPWQRK